MKGITDIFVSILLIVLILLPLFPTKGHIESATTQHKLDLTNVTSTEIKNVFEGISGEYAKVETVRYSMETEFLNGAAEAGWELVSCDTTMFITLNYSEYVFHKKGEK